jgi:hypothetical protein
MTDIADEPTSAPYIYFALAAVMADCKSVAKRDRNEHQRFLFRGIDAVVNAVGPILREHGVIVVPQVRDVQYDVVQTTTGKPATACRILADYVFWAADGSSITATVAAEAWDSGDKAAPKAMSIAFRTALLQALALPTDDPEPDAQTYERKAPARPAPDAPPAEPVPTRKMSRTPKAAEPEPQPGDPMGAKTRGHLFALFTELGVTDRDEQIKGIVGVIKRPIASRSELTEGEGRDVVLSLEAWKAQRAAEDEA